MLQFHCETLADFLASLWRSFYLSNNITVLQLQEQETKFKGKSVFGIVVYYALVETVPMS